MRRSIQLLVELSSHRHQCTADSYGVTRHAAASALRGDPLFELQRLLPSWYQVDPSSSSSKNFKEPFFDEGLCRPRQVVFKSTRLPMPIRPQFRAQFCTVKICGIMLGQHKWQHLFLVCLEGNTWSPCHLAQVDLVRRFGGSTAPNMPWPQETWPT